MTSEQRKKWRSGLTIGSLFSGIGGLELGLEWAGHGETKWQVERDPYASRVLAKHWPNATRYDDVCVVGDELEHVDIICGGFPCQDLSYAGKGAGISVGTRSGLWFEFARIVRLVRPRFVVVENVPALLGRGMGIVLGDLAACGYGVWWDCIPASSVGAPHRRDRVFVVGYADSDGKPAESEHDETPWLPALVANAMRLGFAADGGGGGGPIAPRQPVRFGDRSPWHAEPDVDRVADGVPARVDRLRCLGNAVVPQVAMVVGEVINQLVDSEREREGWL